MPAALLCSAACLMRCVFFVCYYTDVRQQLSDQLKCLDVRLDSHVTMLGELQDFYRRRSEVELEYSRGIDKLVKQIMTRHKTDKQKSAPVSDDSLAIYGAIYSDTLSYTVIIIIIIVIVICY